MAKRKTMIKTRITACSKRRKQKKDIPHLPKEIIFNILSWLPAEFLQNNGKYVCKTWANIIHDPLFIKTHLLHSNAGLFIQRWDRLSDARYLEIKEGKFRMTPLKRHFPVKMLASCEGISLFLLRDPHKMLYVANNVTMQVVKLPCPSVTHESLLYFSSIVRIPHTGDFKVICPYVDLYGLYHWLVLTVGTDMSWRKIYCGLSKDKFVSFMPSAISICGVIYWSTSTWMFDGSSILALDLRDESIHYVRVPKEFIGKVSELLEMGNYLSCIVKGMHWTEVDVCILKDLYMSEWTEVRKIEAKVGQQTLWDCEHHPIAWLDNGRILIFKVFKFVKSGKGVVMHVAAYNVKTGVMRTIKNVDTYNYHKVLVHTNSLVSW